MDGFTLPAPSSVSNFEGSAVGLGVSETLLDCDPLDTEGDDLGGKEAFGLCVALEWLVEHHSAS